MNLSDSYWRTIVTALAHENTPAAIGTLRELERQGRRLPAWIVQDLDRYGRIAAWRKDELHVENCDCRDGFTDEACTYARRLEENLAEREALRREARQEAMLDAGPVLAEHHRSKGE